LYGEHEDQNSSSNPESREGLVLDMENINDLKLLGKALRNNWAVTPERKRAYFAAIDEVIRNADLIECAAKRGMVVSLSVRCLLMEQQHMVQVWRSLLAASKDAASAAQETFGQARMDAKGKEQSFDFEGFASLQRNADKLPGGGK
jgi:hypothetical protein